jgi:hypothetical protein
MNLKTIAPTTVLLAVVLGFRVQQNKSVQQNRDDKVKTEPVSAATIARLPPGKTYEIDLTNKGTIYKFNDEGTDFRRVTIRTAAGSRNFAEMLKRSGTSLKGGLVVGAPSDMRSHMAIPRGGSTHYDCGAVACKCNGLLDCVDLILDGKCDGDFWCNPETGNCFCTPR